MPYLYVYLELKSNKDPNTVITTVSNKLVKLGRMYGGSERYFPIGKYFQNQFMNAPCCVNCILVLYLFYIIMCILILRVLFSSRACFPSQGI